MISGTPLTGEGGQHEVPPDVRSMVCYMSDGRFFVSKAHIHNVHVASLKAKLHRLGLAVNELPVDMQMIQDMYRTSQTGTRKFDASRVQKYAVELFHRAVNEKASDIHIRVSEKDGTKIWFRIHNDLTYKEEQPEEFGQLLCTAIYQSMCDTSDAVFNVRSRQDARISDAAKMPVALDGIRVATAPQVGGVLMVMRLLYNDASGLGDGIHGLGFRKSDIDAFSLMKRRPYGINIIAGPTGSGKSTTLTRLLGGLSRECQNTKHIITVEDPPEYPIPGVVQTPVTDAEDEEARSREFQAAITSAMRLDPDVIMVGEIRDGASAMLAFRAAMTGHQVWTTLHANRALSIPDRLRDLGVPIDILTDPTIVTGLVCQRLIKVLCPHCKQSFADFLKDDVAYKVHGRKAIDNILSVTKLENVYITGHGCDKCSQLGTAGRTVVSETVTPDETLMALLKNEDRKGAIEYWRHGQHGKTMLDHAIEKINEGIVDPFAAERVVGPLLLGMIERDFRIESDEIARVSN